MKPEEVRIRLRSGALGNLGEEDVKGMLKANDFYHSDWHWMGKGVQHDYELQTIGGALVIIDHTTNLMWQQGGSASRVRYENAGEYIAELNTREFAGFDDWHLSTLEEAMSLMEPQRRERDRLYINRLFDGKQSWIWTADTCSASEAWMVYFNSGFCAHVRVDLNYYYYVRAVRSL